MRCKSKDYVRWSQHTMLWQEIKENYMDWQQPTWMTSSGWEMRPWTASWTRSKNVSLLAASRRRTFDSVAGVSSQRMTTMRSLAQSCLARWSRFTLRDAETEVLLTQRVQRSNRRCGPSWEASATSLDFVGQSFPTDVRRFKGSKRDLNIRILWPPSSCLQRSALRAMACATSRTRSTFTVQCCYLWRMRVLELKNTQLRMEGRAAIVPRPGDFFCWQTECQRSALQRTCISWTGNHTRFAECVAQLCMPRWWAASEGVKQGSTSEHYSTTWPTRRRLDYVSSWTGKWQRAILARSTGWQTAGPMWTQCHQLVKEW